MSLSRTVYIVVHAIHDSHAYHLVSDDKHNTVHTNLNRCVKNHMAKSIPITIYKVYGECNVTFNYPIIERFNV